MTGRSPHNPKQEGNNAMNDSTESQERAEYIAGLRELAELLETHPELDAPDTGQLNNPHMTVSLCVSDREQMVAWAKVLTDVTEDTKDAQSLHYIHGRLRGLAFKFFGSADRLGGSTRTVTKRVTEYTVPPILSAVSS